jgi:flagellar capping protein FliD
MATTVERLGIVETKVENLNEKMDDLKVDVKDMHDCLDRTREDLTGQLDKMYTASCDQHSALAQEISSLKSQRDRWVWTAAGGLVVLSWVSSHFDSLGKIVNLL